MKGRRRCPQRPSASKAIGADVLALTWTIETVGGSGAVAEALASTRGIKPSGFALEHTRTPPRITARAGRTSIERLLQVRDAVGRCRGVAPV